MTRTIYVYENPENGEIIESPCEINGWTPVRTYDIDYPDPGSGGGGGGGGESTIAWRPSVSSDGTISWTRTSSTTPPTPVNVKGEKGDTGATGEKGDTGEKGADGAKGDKGDDGYSPTIAVTEITGGHRVTVTDAEGSEYFDVMDGQGGQADSVDWSKVANKPDFATVATSGSYNDLDDKPTIPSAYDDTAITGRVAAMEAALGGHTVGKNVPSDAVFTDTVYDDTALAARVTGVESQFSTRDYIFADALLLDVDLPHTMPWSEFSAMGFPQSTHQENTVYNVVTFNGNYDKEYPKIRYFNDSQEGAIKTIRYKLDERQSSASSEETMVVEYDIANQTATITTGGTAGINKSHIKVYSPRSVYGVSGKVSEDFDLRVLEEAATHGEVASGVAEAKAYTDNKTLAATGWGVVKAEVFSGSAGADATATYTLDLSQYEFTSADDYQVMCSVDWGNNGSNYKLVPTVKNKTASGCVIAVKNTNTGALNVLVYCVVFAKGYGAVAYTGEIPTGGTTDQVLTKRSDADGDYGWQNKLPSYIADKPEGSTPVSGNVVQVGNFTNTDGTEYGIYEFYYRTSALPAADATKVFPLTPLLNDYTVLDFVDATGVTDNGHFIGSGRTDGSNRLIIQQFSKNNKTFTIRAYGDYTPYTALVKIKFIGAKNNA